MGKPTTTSGNSIPVYEAAGYLVIGEAPIPPDMHAPMVVLCSTGDIWIVSAQDCAGGMGFVDFQNCWSSPDESVQGILDFYFGNPERMAKKAARIAEVGG